MPGHDARLSSIRRQTRSKPIKRRANRISALAVRAADFLYAGMARQNRTQRAASTAAAGWAFSAFWHLLCLAVLILEVHPFKIPQETPTVTVELLPPLEPPLERIEPPPRPVEPPPIRLRPIQTEKPAAVVAAKPILTKTLTVQPPPTLTPPTPVPPAPPIPSEAPRQNPPVTLKPIEIQRPPTPVAPATGLNTPLEVAAPPTLTPQAAPTPVQAQATPAPPQPISVQPQSEVIARKAAPLPVLTNDQSTIGPVEIKPPDHPQSAERRAPAAAGGAAAAGGGGTAGGGGGLKPYDGPIAGFGQHGLHTTLGCLNQDTYHLSEADRAACMQRVAREAQGGADLGPNISAEKKAAFDHKVACREAYTNAPMPSIAAGSTGSRLGGLGNVPSLRDCGPQDR